MSFPNFPFWSNLLGTIGIEVCVVVALGIVAQTAFRRAYWKRAMWQMTLLCLVLISASEWTGAGRGAELSLFGKKRIEQTITPQAISPTLKFYTTTIPAAPAPLPAPQSPIWWPGMIWLAGTAIVLGRMAMAQGLLVALRFRREKIADSILQERAVRIAKMLGLRRKVCLLRLPETISPMAFGILFPTIGLPPGFETGFSALEQDAILAHELAHLAALDPLWFRLADFASALLWWHPLVWWARRSLHGASELAADEATALVADGPSSLANCLVGLGKKMTVGHGWSWVGINGEFRSKLGKRVERLTQMPGKAGRPFVSWLDRLTRIAVTLLIAPSIVLLFGAFQTAQGEKENAWRNSWNSSPGMLLAMAAAEEKDQQKEKATIPRLANEAAIEDAKLSYDMGEFDHAELILMHILADDPSNKTATSYLALIKEARSKGEQSMQSKLLMIWSEHEVAARADYLEYSNILSKLRKLPETKLGDELLSHYGNLADSELKEKSARLSFTRERLSAAKSEYSNKENPKYKRAVEEFQQAKDDYDNKAVAIFEIIGARVNQLSNYLQLIIKNEDDIKIRHQQQTAIAALEKVNKTPSQATSETPPKDLTEINTRIADAKLFYEMGKLSEAKAKLNQLLQDDPSNKTVAYYLHLVMEAQLVNQARKQRHWDYVEGPHTAKPPVYIPPPSDTPGPIRTTTGRQNILSKLDTIRLDEVQYDLPLTEVLSRLRIESQKRDTNGEGINFLINPHMDAAPGHFLSDTNGTSPPGAIPIVAPTPNVDMGTVTIKISPPLTDIRLMDILNAITMGADQPIKCTIEDYAVVFSPKPAVQLILYSKTYHVDPNTFVERLKQVCDANQNVVPLTLDSGTTPAASSENDVGAGQQNGAAGQVGLRFVTRTNNTVQLDRMVRNYFTSLGVDLTDPGKSVFFSDSRGILLVRATAEDLQRVEQGIAQLNQAPPQADIETDKSEKLLTKAFRIYPSEFKKNLMAAIGVVPGSGVEGTNDNAKLTQMLLAYFAKAGVKVKAPDEEIVFDDRLEVLMVRATSEELQIIEQILKPLNRVPPQLTIEGKFVDLPQEEANVLGPNFELLKGDGDTKVMIWMSDKEFRTTLDKIKNKSHADILGMPKVTTLSGRQAHMDSMDAGNGVALDVIATVGEDGFSIDTTAIASIKDNGKKWEAVAKSQKLMDGQTLVMGQIVFSTNPDARKIRFVFVTVTIIDAAGNRVHSDEEIERKP